MLIVVELGDIVMVKDENKGIRLSKLVDAVKEDLREYHAEQMKGDQLPMFSVKEATVEVEVVASATGEENYGLDLRVVKWGSSSTDTTGASFRLSLSLTPLSGTKEMVMGTQMKKRR